jgi:hypothetical protein
MSQKWYKKASTQGAIIAGMFVLFAAVITGIFGLFNQNPVPIKHGTGPNTPTKNLNSMHSDKKVNPPICFTNVPVLVATGDIIFDKDRDFDLIKSVWKGDVHFLSSTTKNDLLTAMRNGFPIVHLVANFGDNFIELKDGKLSADKFNDLLKVAGGQTKLLVLIGCNSFTIGKAMEGTGLKYSIVVTSNLSVQIAEVFTKLFYSYLSDGYRPSDAFWRSEAELSVRYGPISHVFYFNEHK